jgi:hypothetical protein
MRGVIALLQLHALGFEPLPEVSKVGVWSDLEGDTGAFRLAALLQLNRKIADLCREIDMAVLAAGLLKPYDLREVINLSFEIGRLECDVAHAFDLNHEALRLSAGPQCADAMDGNVARRCVLFTAAARLGALTPGRSDPPKPQGQCQR